VPASQATTSSIAAAQVNAFIPIRSFVMGLLPPTSGAWVRQLRNAGQFARTRIDHSGSRYERCYRLRQTAMG
jgi:hypothetical protein